MSLRALCIRHRVGNVLSALAAARDLPHLNLVDSLELTVLVARKDPHRHPPVAARWLLRLLEEQPDVTIEEAALHGGTRRGCPYPGRLRGVARSARRRLEPLQDVGVWGEGRGPSHAALTLRLGPAAD